MIWIFTLALWFGLLTLRVPGRWALTLFEVALLALAVILIVRNRFAIRLHPVALLLAAAASWGLLQVALGASVDSQRTLEAVLHWSIDCVAFSLALVLLASRSMRRRFLSAQLVFALILSIVAVIGQFTVSALGPFVYRNQFAAYVEVALGLAIATAIRDRRRSMIWMLVSAALFASVVAAGSRAGAILCLSEFIALPLLAFVRGELTGRTLARVAILGAAATALLIGVVGFQSIWQRLQEPNPYAMRADLVRSSLAMARDRPSLGFGLGTWSAAYPAYALFDDGTFVNQAHNDWVQWLDEGGIPLLLAILAIVALLARPAVRSLWGLGLVAVSLHALVDYPLQQRPALAAFFFAMAGALAAEATSGSKENFPGGLSPRARPLQNSLQED